MLIRVGFDIEFHLPAESEMLLTLFLHPSRAASVRKPEALRTDPAMPMSRFTDLFGNQCARVAAPAGLIRFQSEAIVEDSGEPDCVNPGAAQHRIYELPPDTLPFLLASRYCEVDSELNELAWKLFSSTPTGWPRVQAICDYVHGHLKFDYMQARSTRTALEAHRERVGVCRDFMHLAITLCRCMNIPARYATGYLGDIAVPPMPCPMDFSAWFEVFIGGRWHTFDARHNVPRVGRVLMATGRDAADVALTTSFGRNTLNKFIVFTDEVLSADPHGTRAPVAVCSH